MDIAHIVFTGLCTFAAANADNDQLPMAAIFPSDPHNEHHVYLMVDDTFDVSVDHDDLPRRFGKAYSEMGRAYQYILLDDESVRVENMASSTLLVHPDAPFYDDVPGPYDADTMHWVPHMAVVWKQLMGRHVAASIALSQTPHTSPRLVQARMELTGGILAPSYVSNDVWEFSQMFHFTRRQAIAQEVTLETELTTSNSELILTTRGLDAQNVGREVAKFVITRINKSVTDPITVLLADVMPQDLLPGGYVTCSVDSTECPLGNGDPCPATCIDHHFAIFYDSLYAQHQNSPVLPRRVVAGVPSQVFALRVGGQNCGGNNYP